MRLRLTHIILLLAILGTAHADVLVLQTGQRLEGTIVQESPESVTIRLPEGKITYARAKVKAVEKGAIAPAADRPLKTPPTNAPIPTPAAFLGFERMLLDVDPLLEEYKEEERRLKVHEKNNAALVLRRRNLEAEISENAGGIRQAGVREAQAGAQMQSSYKGTVQYSSAKDQAADARSESSVLAAERNRLAAEKEKLKGLRSRQTHDETVMDKYRRRIFLLAREHRAALNEHLQVENLQSAMPYLRQLKRTLEKYVEPLDRDWVAVEERAFGSVVVLNLDDFNSARMLVNPQRPVSTINQSALSALAVAPETVKEMSLLPEGGQAESIVAKFPEFMLGNTKLGPGSLLVRGEDEEDSGIDGVLGQDVLRHLRLRMDNGRKAFQISPLFHPQE